MTVSERLTPERLREMAAREERMAGLYDATTDTSGPGWRCRQTVADEKREIATAFRQAAADATIVDAIRAALDRNGYVRILRPTSNGELIHHIDDGTALRSSKGWTLADACNDYLGGGAK
jgi:hypothetical protein